MYDVIGDIHGYADALKRLLTKMGYRRCDGVWQHPERKVVFLGDFIDRGPQQVETLEIALDMVENGTALAVMGNHEFNAVAFATPHPDKPGEYLRPHTEKNLRQHEAFLAQIGKDESLYRRVISRFKALPLYLDLDEFRVVHACWHLRHVRALDPYLDAGKRLKEESWLLACRAGGEAFEAVETLLKGLEVPLPVGHEFRDKDGHVRRRIRTEWWNQDAITYRDLALVPEDVIADIPHVPVPEDVVPGYRDEKPVFVGHYWLKGDPAPLTEKIACLDYSVVDRQSGKLCAYRWGWEVKEAGALRRENFCWVDS